MAVNEGRPAGCGSRYRYRRPGLLTSAARGTLRARSKFPPEPLNYSFKRLNALLPNHLMTGCQNVGRPC